MALSALPALAQVGQGAAGGRSWSTDPSRPSAIVVPPPPTPVPPGWVATPGHGMPYRDPRSLREGVPNGVQTTRPDAVLGWGGLPSPDYGAGQVPYPRPYANPRGGYPLPPGNVAPPPSHAPGWRGR